MRIGAGGGGGGNGRMCAFPMKTPSKLGGVRMCAGQRRRRRGLYTPSRTLAVSRPCTLRVNVYIDR